MNDLRSAHIDNYRIHPAFSFGEHQWVIEQDVLNRFNDCYSLIRDYSSSLTYASVMEVEAECFASLDVLFSSMSNQSADDYERLFLRELLVQARRVLSEEFSWYSKRRPERKCAIRSEKLRLELSSLVNQRHFVDRLSDSAVKEILDASKSDVAMFRERAEAGRVSRGDLSVNTGRTVARVRRILNREFRKMGILEVLSSYTGRSVRVVGLSLELSVPSAKWWRNSISGLVRPPKTMYTHFDESISLPKAIVYLSDVELHNGATKFSPNVYERMELTPLQEIIGRVVAYAGMSQESALSGYYKKGDHQSVGSEGFRRHFMRLPDSLRFNSHLGWDVFPDSDFEQQLVHSEHVLRGVAGTFVVFDGAKLFHRGGMVESGERIALQVIFSDMTLTERVIARMKRMFA